MPKTKSNFKKGALTKIERFTIIGAITEGQSLEDVAKLLNRNPKSAAIKKIVDQLKTTPSNKPDDGMDEETAKQWEPVIRKVHSQLTKQNQMDSTKASKVIGNTIKKMDLMNTPPNPESLLQAIQKHNSALKLFTNYSEQGVIAMNHAASSADPPNSQKGNSVVSGGIFRPNSGNVE